VVFYWLDLGLDLDAEHQAVGVWVWTAGEIRVAAGEAQGQPSVPAACKPAASRVPPKKASERMAFVAKSFIEDLLSRVTRIATLIYCCDAPLRVGDV